MHTYTKALTSKLLKMYEYHTIFNIPNTAQIQNLGYHPDKAIINNYTNTCRNLLNKCLQKHPNYPKHNRPNKHFIKYPKITKRTLRKLHSNNNITIKPADKNLGLVIMNTSDYIHAGETKLHNTCNYKTINTNLPYDTILKNLIDILIECELLEPITKEQEIHYTMPIDWSQFKENTFTSLTKLLLFYFDHPDLIKICRFYILPKMHKDPIGWREICSSPGWVTFIVSMFIDIILQPILTNIPTYVKDSADFIENTYQLPLQQSYAFLQADVESLYPSIDINDGLQALSEILSLTNFNNKFKTLIIKLTKWVLINNYMTFNNKTYLQINGTAMGTPLAVTYAGLFMHILEKRALSKINFQNYHSPIIYKRLMDDLVSVHIFSNNASHFIQTLQNILPNKIKFTYNISTIECTFLDITIYKHKLPNDKLILATKLYQKPMNKYLFIPFFSNHPTHIHKGWITGYIKRIRLNCNNTIHYLLYKHTFYLHLLTRGYTYKFLKPLFSKKFKRSTILTKIKTHRKSKTNPNNIKNPQLFFKLQTCAKNNSIKKSIRSSLKYSQELTMITNAKKIFGENNTHPCLCYLGGHTIGSTLVKSNT